MKSFHQKIHKYTGIAFLLLLLQGCYEEQIIFEDDQDFAGEKILMIDQAYGFVDMTDKFILYTIASDTIPSFTPFIHFLNYSSVYFNDIELENNKSNNLGDVFVNHPYILTTYNRNKIDTFRLIFTSFPIMSISTTAEIINEPKTHARIALQYYNMQHTGTQLFTSHGGIEYRGASSLRYNKKSYGFELWRYESGVDFSASLLGMNKGEDWILDAMYIDDLRMRNKLSYELWEKMSKVPAVDHRPEVVPGIHCELIELFINNRYEGIYSLNEKLDVKLLRYSSNQDELGGVLYKANQWGDGGTLFSSYKSDPPEDYFWDGWELIYPDQFSGWQALENLRKLIVLSDDEEFSDEIGNFFEIDNAVNHFLFLNLTRAADNSGKNNFLVRYTDHSPFFYIPWDIEASWGLFWNREKIGSEGISSNNLYKRLMETNAEDFNEELHDSWFYYRTNIFSEEELIKPIYQYYSQIKKNGVIEREYARWGEYDIDLDLEYEFIVDWIRNRLIFLDNYFESSPE